MEYCKCIIVDNENPACFISYFRNRFTGKESKYKLIINFNKNKYIYSLIDTTLDNSLLYKIDGEINPEAMFDDKLDLIKISNMGYKSNLTNKCDYHSNELEARYKSLIKFGKLYYYGIYKGSRIIFSNSKDCESLGS